MITVLLQLIRLLINHKGGGVIVAGSPAKIIGYTKDLNYNISSNQKDLDGIAPYLQPKE